MKLSPRQVELFYLAPERDEFGQVVSAPVVVGRPMSGRKLFAYRMFLLGIRDPETVERLWQEEKAKRPPEKRRRR